MLRCSELVCPRDHCRIYLGIDSLHLGSLSYVADLAWQTHNEPQPAAWTSAGQSSLELGMLDSLDFFESSCYVCFGPKIKLQDCRWLCTRESCAFDFPACSSECLHDLPSQQTCSAGDEGCFGHRGVDVDSKRRCMKLRICFMPHDIASGTCQTRLWTR
jgi:hypothetical protein